MPSVLARNPAFRRLWAAGAVSLIGDWLSLVAVATLALGSGGAMSLALVFAAHALPAALLSPFAGALLDRTDRKRALVVTDLVACALTVLMMLAAMAGRIGAVQLVLLVRSAVTSLSPPGESAAVRRLVPAGDLVAANSILAATWSCALVAGMSLGGVAALLGPALALGLDAATFAVAAAVRMTLPAMPVAADRGASLAAIARATPADTVAALRVAAAQPALLRAVLAKTPISFAGGAGWVALNLIGASVQPFGAAGLSFGILQAVRGAGTGLGPALVARLVRGGVSPRWLNAAACTLHLGAVAALGVVRSPLGLVVVALLWGMGGGSNWVMAHTALQRRADDAVIGRLAAFDELLATLAVGIGAFAGAGAAMVAGERATTLIGVALGVAALAVAGWIARPRPVPVAALDLAA